jgi:c-di-GMP-binding flagellar brake protein YcgR
MSDQSIEFQKTKENIPLPEIVRKSFRIPIEDKESVWVVINKKRYQVLDICLGGIGIALEKKSQFTSEQTLSDCELTIFDVSIKNLNAQIVHLTSDKDENLQCGVQWIDLEKGVIDQISEIVLKMKEQLLKED